MLIVTEKRHGIDIVDCWFAKDRIDRNGVVRYKQSLVPIGDSCDEFRTLVTDLSESEEDILSHISKNGRYEIRRAPKEGITCESYVGRNISEAFLKEYFDFFEEFWKSKGIEYSEKDKQYSEALKYVQNEAYAITIARKDDKILVYHTYIVGDDFVRLYQSASQFRTDENVTGSVIGFANRYLHYEDMKFFKKLGKVTYDWGGAGLNEDVASITKFKESFGGNEKIQYNSEETVGAAAKLYRKATGIIGGR